MDTYQTLQTYYQIRGKQALQEDLATLDTEEAHTYGPLLQRILTTWEETTQQTHRQ